MKRILVVALAMCGCSAAMVNAPGGQRSAFAPINEAARPGVVSYLNQGAGFIVRARREDAYKQMHTACGGPYRIDAEGPQAGGGVVTAVGRGSAIYTPTQYWYIQFSCARPVAAQ